MSEVGGRSVRENKSAGLSAAWNVTCLGFLMEIACAGLKGHPQLTAGSANDGGGPKPHCDNQLLGPPPRQQAGRG